LPAVPRSRRRIEDVTGQASRCSQGVEGVCAREEGGPVKKRRWTPKMRSTQAPRYRIVDREFFKLSPDDQVTVLMQRTGATAEDAAQVRRVAAA
jgi:hypothetical protein